MFNPSSSSSALGFVAGMIVVMLSVSLGYWMRGAERVDDVRVNQLSGISGQLTELKTSVGVLVNADQTYWRGYSEGLTACYAANP
jgi:membrane protein implicated in regulation of membrane protease activity